MNSVISVQTLSFEWSESFVLSGFGVRLMFPLKFAVFVTNSLIMTNMIKAYRIIGDQRKWFLSDPQKFIYPSIGHKDTKTLSFL